MWTRRRKLPKNKISKLISLTNSNSGRGTKIGIKNFKNMYQLVGKKVIPSTCDWWDIWLVQHYLVESPLKFNILEMFSSNSALLGKFLYSNTFSSTLVSTTELFLNFFLNRYTSLVERCFRARTLALSMAELRAFYEVPIWILSRRSHWSSECPSFD